MLAELELRERPKGRVRELFRTSSALPDALSMPDPIRGILGDAFLSVDEELLLFEALFVHDSEGFGQSRSRS